MDANCEGRSAITMVTWIAYFNMSFLCEADFNEEVYPDVTKLPSNFNGVYIKSINCPSLIDHWGL